MYANHMTTAWWILASLGGAIVWGLILWARFSLLSDLRDRRATRRPRATPGEMLEHRLAHGEIGLEEYERIRTALGASATVRAGEPRDPAHNRPPATAATG